jgi:hypothetical protein
LFLGALAAQGGNQFQVHTTNRCACLFAGSRCAPRRGAGAMSTESNLRACAV